MSQETPLTIQIETMDQLAHLVGAWHENVIMQLEQAMLVPDSVEISFTDPDTGTDVALTPEQRRGFLAGLTMAKAIFDKLPFDSVDVEEEAEEVAHG